MILGLDISSSKIGIALLGDKEEIILSDYIKLNPKDSLERRAEIFKNYLSSLMEKHGIANNNHQNDIGEGIKQIYVEAPFVAFSGGSSAKTVSTLQRFNGMCCYAIYHLTGIIPVLLNANSVRSKLGIKIPRGKKKSKREKATHHRFRNK